MIYIKKDEVNQIILTLTEVSTLPNPYYLLLAKLRLIRLPYCHLKLRLVQVGEDGIAHCI